MDKKVSIGPDNCYFYSNKTLFNEENIEMKSGNMSSVTKTNNFSFGRRKVDHPRTMLKQNDGAFQVLIIITFNDFICRVFVINVVQIININEI